MIQRNVRQDIKKALCDLTFVEQTLVGYEIALPQIYHTGETVCITVRQEGDFFIIHDDSAGMMSLESSGTVLSSRTLNALQKGVEAYGCEISGSRVLKRTQDFSDVAAFVAIVGCASRFVADYGLHLPAQAMFDFRKKAVNTLREILGDQRLRENEEITTSLGSKYHVSAAVLDARLVRTIAYIEAISGHQSSTRKFRSLFEIAKTPEIGEISRFSLYDDTSGSVTAGDIDLLKTVSHTVPFKVASQTFSNLHLH
ncbi:MAG: hypothetical protein SOI54_08225 [Acetobacter sp.]